MHTCKNFEVLEVLEGTVCNLCGLMISCVNISDIGSYEEIQNLNITFSKSEQKNISLNKYIYSILVKLELPTIIHNSIADIAFVLITSVYKYLNSKGSYLKKALIVITAYKLYNIYSYTELIKKIDLPIKYISKAEMNIAELVSTKKIPFNILKNIHSDHPIRFIYNIIHINKLTVSQDILQQTHSLISKCMEIGMTSDHQPSSIAISSLFFIIKQQKIDIDIRIFSNIYGLSHITISKIHDKIKLHLQNV
jgi:transcription initiation factor TFIIIB Brf1 subunit/transcription initiation factor TFIIB